MRYFNICLVAVFALAAGCAFARAQAGTEAAFERWVRDFRSVAQAAGIRLDVYDRAFAGVLPDPAILRSADNQAEFVRAIWDYLDSAVSQARIEGGREKAARFSADLRAIEEKWGVDRMVLVAIWGLESSYGAILDNPKIVKGVVRSLATLAFQGAERAEFGRTQLIAALKILQNGDIASDRLTGSWAGAMGHTQFIPTTYLAHAVDYDGDGRRDIWSAPPQDALASSANYLAASGWERGHGWGYEVRLPEGFDYGLADGKTRKSIEKWSTMGIARIRGNSFPRPEDEARLFLPAGASGPAFLLLKNFDVIKRYNNADAYALAIGHLSDRLKGFGPVKAEWPRHLRPLTRSQAEELQMRLNEKGFDTGGVDGQLGPKSRAAVRAYQRDAGLVPDGFATDALLERLRSGS